MNHQNRFIVSLILLLCTLAACVYAKGAGTTSGTFLTQPLGARAIAMGNAYTASRNDVFGFFANPAHTLDTKQFAAVYQKGVIDEQFGAIALGFPLKRGNVAMHVVYYDGGEIEMYNPDVVKWNVQAEKDMIQTLYINQRISILTLGVGMKHFSSRLVDKFTADTFALDAGASINLTKHFCIAGAYQNMGGQLQYISTKEKLPETMRLGARLSLLGLTVCADTLYLCNEEITRENFGAELTFAHVLSVRGGYKVGYDVETLTCGAGIAFWGCHIDYAYVPYSDLGQSHVMSMNIEF